MEYEPLYEETCDQTIPHDCPIHTPEDIAIMALVDEMYKRLGY